VSERKRSVTSGPSAGPVLAAVCVLSIVAAAALALGVAGPAGWALTVTALLVAPGCVVVSLLDLAEGPLQVALVIPLSVAVLVVCSTVSLWIGAWHPVGAAVVVLGASGSILGFLALRERRAGAVRGSERMT
jgi:hypothetical protein